MSIDLIRTVKAGDVFIDTVGNRRVATKDGIYFPCPMTLSPEELADLLSSKCGYKRPKKEKRRRDGDEKAESDVHRGDAQDGRAP